MTPEVNNKPKHNLEWTGERILPEDGRYMFRRHLQAYQFSMNFCQDKVILDAGCGEGYGSHLLSEIGSKVIGIDISEEAVRHAKRKYIRENLKYQTMNVTNLDFADNSFDVVVCFQVIEHLHDIGKFLNKIKRLLRKNGCAIISTIINKRPLDDDTIGEYHVKEYRYNEFVDLLNTFFGEVEYYGVHREGKDPIKVWFYDLILKFDIFRIRKLFTSRFKKKITVSTEKTISLNISKENLKDALDIIGVYKKS